MKNRVRQSSPLESPLPILHTRQSGLPVMVVPVPFGRKVMKILNYAFKYQYQGSEAKALDLYSGVHIPANRRGRKCFSSPSWTPSGEWVFRKFIPWMGLMQLLALDLPWYWDNLSFYYAISKHLSLAPFPTRLSFFNPNSSGTDLIRNWEAAGSWWNTLQIPILTESKTWQQQ